MRCLLLCLFAPGVLLPTVGNAQTRQAGRLRQADVDGDGKLSAMEAGSRLWERLKHFDADEDGRLTENELAAAGMGDNKAARLPGGANASFDVISFDSVSGHSMAYSLFVPEIQPGKLPLVVCLHGRGGSTLAANVAASRKVQSKQPCFVMAPACDGRTARWIAGAMRSKPSHRSVLPELIEAIDDLVDRREVDPNRIYLTGQSMGGVGTWGIIASFPEKFAAAAPVCGTWDVKDAVKIKDVPIWAFHGAKDTTVPVDGSRDMISAIRQAGGKPKYTEFPEVGHGSWERAYADDNFWDWLFEQSLASAVKAR